MNRVILVNLNKAPSREEIATTEREVGEDLLRNAGVSATYAGYIVVPGAMKLAPQWLVEDHQVPAAAGSMGAAQLEGYQAQLFVSNNGGSVRVV